MHAAVFNPQRYPTFIAYKEQRHDPWFNADRA